MFEGPYRERAAPTIEIPNISWDVFEAMMRYVYTGTVGKLPARARFDCMLAHSLLGPA